MSNTSNLAGGGIANNGGLMLIDSTISDNSASASFTSVGGGLLNAGSLTATNSVFLRNKAQGDGFAPWVTGWRHLQRRQCAEHHQPGAGHDLWQHRR
jgi:hypothetical protein